MDKGPQRMPGLRIVTDEEGLIVPRKPHNPCLVSQTVKDLNHQIRWNARTGVNVLEKSELKKVMDQRRWKSSEQEKADECEAKKTELQRIIEDRARRLEKVDDGDAPCNNSGSSSEDSGHSSPEPSNELLKVRAKLKHRAGSPLT